MPDTLEPSGSTFIDRLRADCGYHPDAEGSVDALIDYKDALEDIVQNIDGLALCNSSHPAAERLREAEGWQTLSAADVMGGIFNLGLGRTAAEIEPEVRPDGPETDKGGLIGQQPY